MINHDYDSQNTSRVSYKNKRKALISILTSLTIVWTFLAIYFQWESPYVTLLEGDAPAWGKIIRTFQDLLVIAIVFMLVVTTGLTLKRSLKIFSQIRTVFILYLVEKFFGVIWCVAFLIGYHQTFNIFDFFNFTLNNAFGIYYYGGFHGNIFVFLAETVSLILLIISFLFSRNLNRFMRTNFSVTGDSVLLNHASTSIPPQVASGWYPNPLANNAVMYWDGAEWLNIPAPAQMSTSTVISGLAIAAFVTAFFMPMLPIIFGHISLNRIKQSNGRIGGKGLAISGLVLGYVALVGWIFIFIGMVVANN